MIFQILTITFWVTLHAPFALATEKKVTAITTSIIEEESTQVTFEDTITSVHDSDGYLFVNFTNKKRAYQTKDESLIEKVRAALADKSSLVVTVDTETDTLLKIKQPTNSVKNKDVSE